MATAQELAQQLYEIRSQISVLKLQEAEVVEALAAEMEPDKLELPGVGVFERRRKSDRKAWDHEALYSRVLRMVREGAAWRYDSETGERIDEDPTEQAFRVLNELARHEWRKTALDRYGIDADEYCSVTRGGFSVQFHGELEGEVA